jgi:hypothetical protein
VRSLLQEGFIPPQPSFMGSPRGFFLCALFLCLIVSALHGHTVLADVTSLPGDDASSKMESAGTLLRFIDTGIFKWAARVLAGLCIFGAAWNLKEARFGPAVISIVSAILFGTAPTWVKNIFTIGGSDSVFTEIEQPIHVASRMAFEKALAAGKLGRPNA